MKKSYLLLFAIGLSSVAFGQKKVVAKKPNSTKLSVDVTSVKANQNLVSKAEGDLLFPTETFNGSANGWTTSGQDASVWMFDTDGPDGQYSSTTNADLISSTTAGNGFMIFDADLSNPAQPFVNRQGSLVSPVYDLTGRTNVSIRFQHAYRTCCSGDFFPKLEVSTDGFVTFTTYDVTATGIGVNDFSETVIKEVNINDYLVGATNLNNFQLRFNFDGVSGSTSHYFWQVDDIELFEPYSFSLEALVPYWGTFGFWGPRLPYSMVPKSQIAEVAFSVITENKGSVDQTDIVLNTAIPEGPFNDAGPASAIAAFSQDTLDANLFFTPNVDVLTTYHPTFNVTSGNADINIADNTLMGDSIMVTDNVYARDKNVIDGGSFNQGEGFEVGNIFDMFANAVIVSGSVFVRSTSNEGAQVYLKLYDLDPITRDFRFVAETSPVTIDANNKGTLITMNFDQNYDLLKDSSYLLVAGSFGDGGATNDLVVATAGASEAQTSYYFDMTDATWYYTTATPIVRMNFESTLGINTNTNINNLSVYPNPAKDKIAIEINLNNKSNVSLNITDLTGKVVLAKELGNQKAGNHTYTVDTNTISNGVYVMNIVTNGVVSAHKLVINK
ncbi:MAG: T9SS type A sorting domain-containing protein [Flavobacteriia bacterium]|jgi:hypothetical protein